MRFARNAMKQTAYQGKYLRIIHEDQWEYVQRCNCTGIVVIACETGDGKYILVEQFRKPVGKHVIEWPAGLVNDLEHIQEETLETAALRELEEETGYRAKTVEHQITGPVSSGLSSDSLTFFTATGLQKISQGGGDETENITVHEVPANGIDAWLEEIQKQGRLVDPKVYAGIYFLKKFKIKNS